MGLYDYRDFSSEESAKLVDLTHQIAVATNLTGFPDISGLLGNGLLTGGETDVSHPDGWRALSAGELGLPDSIVDILGFIKLKGPLLGYLPTGPQLQVMVKEDANGNVTGLAISYAATNSIVDIPDYAQLNTGEMAAAMEPVLQAVRDYAIANGVAGEDVMVTGYSLGGGYTNVQARFADTLAGGFFKDSLYVGHAAPVVYEDDDRVLNVGYENDVVHRATGDAQSFWGAVFQADPLLQNSDRALQSSNDNVVIFDGAYIGAPITLAIDSILNPLAWWAHLGGALTDATARIGQSTYYEYTERDSVVVVSNLGAIARKTFWVGDKESPTSNHFGDPAFIVGTRFDDKLHDGAANDWLDGGAGNDLIRVSSGLNRVDGGEGRDTLRLQGNASDFTVYRLADGSLAFKSANGLTIAENIEEVEFATPYLFGLLESKAQYSVQSNRLEDERWSLFEWGDRDIAYASATQGDARDNTLSGRNVFGLDGNDRLTGTAQSDLLHGGEGRDILTGGAGDDRLYGAEDADILIAGTGTDRLNGGHGDDVFVFDARISGRAVVEDFNQAENEGDMLQFLNGSADAALASARQSGDDVVLRHGSMTIVLEETSLADLQSDSLLV